LRKTLHSISEQSFKDFEVIVSDDSTHDVVKKLVEEYSEIFPIKYVQQSPSLGSPKNWNFCLDYAKGEWIKFVHHDDWFAHADSLARFVTSATTSTSDFIFCDSSVLNVKEGSMRVHQPSEQFIEDLRKDVRCLFTDNQIGAPSAVMFRKSNFRFDERLKYLVDIDFYMRYLLGSKPVVYLPEALIVNTSHGEQQVTAASLNRETQVGEYAYLYNKIFAGTFPNAKVRSLFRSLFKKYQVYSQVEIRELISNELQPAWCFSYLMKLSKWR
jgi:glycosyltransferase involved in cell wall biosynthesis